MALIIEPQKVSPEGSMYEGEELPTTLEVGDSEDIRADNPIKYELFVQVVSHELVVKGRIYTEMALECSRCADFFSTYIEDSSFLRAYEISEEVETVDLTEDLREAVLLKLPSHPLCSPECKGLCQRCGQNLNVGSCDCEQPHWDGRWGALDQLDSK